MQRELNNIIALRFILRQPSPMWKEYRLDDIICYKTSVTAPTEITLPVWMTEGNKRPHAQLKVIILKYCILEKGVRSSFNVKPFTAVYNFAQANSMSMTFFQQKWDIVYDI